ncbi:hypothetical protein Cni_G17505 [Canna indica]|uniref:Uncharacterized protein n=1 Tax=Canna indica TaxID=4628 RepID=A0AAQ3KIX6_9LILI|nr:hypothetical protein Cni_G17505 [Canna indica]
METSSGSTDSWRNFFRSAKADIFHVLEQAILVAATDNLEEFLSRRGQIAEKLYGVQRPRCFGCDCIEVRGDEKEAAYGCNNGSAVLH